MMRVALLALLLGLGGCVSSANEGLAPSIATVTISPPVVAPAEQPRAVEAEKEVTAPVEDYLGADVGARFPKRAIVFKRGPVSFTPDGANVGLHPEDTNDGRRPTVVVVEEREQSLRLVLTQNQLRLAVFMPRSAMTRVATSATSLSLAAGAAPDPEAMARVASGTWLIDLGAAGDWSKVTSNLSGVMVTGWVPATAVGEVFVPARFAGSGGNGSVADGAVIASAKGDVVARLDSQSKTPVSFPVDALPGAPAGFQRVALRYYDVEVIGLVRMASYRAGPPVSGPISMSGGDSYGGMSHSQVATLAKDAAIFDDTGNKVGVATADVQVWLGNDPITKDPGLRRATVYSGPIGFCEVKVRSSDLSAGFGKLRPPRP